MLASILLSKGQTDSLPITKHFSVAVESGFNSYSSSSEYDFVRAGVLETSNASSMLNSISFQPYANVNFVYNVNEKIAFSGGFKYVSSFAVVGNSLFDNSENNFFYLHSKTDNLNTYYYRVNNIRQKVQYVGIPIDFRYSSPFYLPYLRIFGRVGTDIMFKVSEESNVEFYNENSEIHEQEVIQLFDQAKTTFIALNFSLGYQLGKQGKPNLLIGANLPSIILNGRGSGIVNPGAGIGMYATLIVPIM